VSIRRPTYAPTRIAVQGVYMAMSFQQPGFERA
jgi:hypothetical protein